MITFPGLGLEFNISKIAISILGINIYWYAIFIVIAIILSLIILKINNKNEEVKYENILDLAIYLIPISIICARLYYIIFFDIEYYIQNPIQILNLKSGGLAIYGGIIGGLITIYVYCKIKKLNALSVLDQIAPCLALGQAIGRWGNFINIEAYGTETNNIFRMGIIENGVYEEVHPTFLYESIADLIIFIILILIGKNRQKNGERTLLYLIMYSFVRFFIEGIRIDSLMLKNIRISQIVSLSIFVVSCCILIYKHRKTRKLAKICKKWRTKNW